MEKRFSGAVTLQQRGRFARRRKVILGAADYVESHYRQVIRLEDVCAHVGLSANRFSQLFRDVTGQTLMEYVNFIRIQHARELMINTDWTERRNVPPMWDFTATSISAACFGNIPAASRGFSGGSVVGDEALARPGGGADARPGGGAASP